jgi:hypothetical protein
MPLNAAYFGPVVISMVLLSLGLSLTTAPSTEAVMGSLRADQVGAGAAVNNTTRELGGTLGVAVLGSVFASTFGPHVTSALRALGVPPHVASSAGVSMADALGVARQLPEAIQGAALHASSLAFVDALHAACAVGAGVAAAGSLVAFAFLGEPRVRSTSEVSDESVPVAA